MNTSLSPRLPALLLAILAAFASSSLVDAQNGEPIPYYTLRFEAVSTSDWATVYIDTLPSWNCRIVSHSEDIVSATTGRNRASLVQPLEAAMADREARMVFECAMPPEVFRRDFDLRVEKGHLGRTVLGIQQVLPDGLLPLGEWVHDGIVPDADALPNTVYLSLDLRSVLDAQPSEVLAPDAPKKALAFYFPWYSRQTWDSRQGLKDVPLQPYDSDNLSAIARHIEQAKSAGISGFVVSWSGASSQSDQAIAKILQIATLRDFAVAARFETIAGGQARSETEIEQQLSALLNLYGSHPAFLKIGGRPVIFVGDSQAVARDGWSKILGVVETQATDGFFLGQSADQNDLEVFDSLYTYAVTDFGNLSPFVFAVRPASRYRKIFDDPPELVLQTATVQPGYDDELVAPEAESRFVDRQDGAAYQSTIDVSAYRAQEWILITSWNQFFQNTHIEPSEQYGDQYLRLTAEMVDQWLGPRPIIYPGGVVNSASYRHDAVALGEITTIFGQGLGPDEICTLELMDGFVERTLCDTEVTFNGNPAPILYTQADTVSAVVPLGLLQASARVQVRYRGVLTAQKSVRILPAVPGIFTLDASGTGQAAALLSHDYSVNRPENPADRNSTVLVYITGGGPTDPPGETGALVSQIETLDLPVRVEIDGLPAPVSYAGSAPGQVTGVVQLNVQIPGGASPGDAVPFAVWIANYPAQDGVTLAVR